MSYTVATALGVLAAVLVDLAVLRTALVRRAAFWTAYAIVLFFQLVVNGTLTGLRIVRYDAAAILGWRIVNAPVEDLLFGFAMVLITLSGWVAAGRPAERRRRRAAPSAPPPPAGPNRRGPDR